MTMHSIPPRGANGVLPLSLGLFGAFYDLTITGGPFDGFQRRTDLDFGVCVRAERVPPKVDVRLPIRDFQVPTDTIAVENALIETFQAAIDGKHVWVGCMGGWGRTGLFMALMAKVAGVADPVAYVRDSYTPRAVETAEQHDYVDEFDVSDVRRVVGRYAWVKRLPFLGWIVGF
jgi:hypothetical protein